MFFFKYAMLYHTFWSLSTIMFYQVFCLEYEWEEIFFLIKKKAQACWKIILFYLELETSRLHEHFIPEFLLSD